MKALTISIGGMSCNHCVGAVNKALAGMPGVTVDQVAIGSATVQYDETATSPEQIAAVVEDEGYTVTAS